MGCNSHLYIERRTDWPARGEYPAGHRWDCWGFDISEERWYYLYGALAGVRGDTAPIVQPRGIPSDLSPEVAEAFDSWGPDFHTPTYLYPQEFKAAMDDVRRAMKENGGDGEIDSKTWLAVEGTLLLLEKLYGNENVRIVIAFDN